MKTAIRNFSIIAHIDHGKSTLADRLIEAAGLMPERGRRDQYLDRMDLERERGITIKSQMVRLPYVGADGNTYQLNLIDTPGHVDFSYEVSRSLAACEGVLLVVDAVQGIEAQTLANANLALEQNLVIVPVINKIDLEQAEPDRVKAQIEGVLGIAGDECLLVSAKEGIGIPEVFEAVVQRIPPPRGSLASPLRALLVDSWYDSYQGVVMLVRVVDGALRPGLRVRLLAAGRQAEVDQLGTFAPEAEPLEELLAGEVGWCTAGIKEIRDATVGETITEADRPCDEPLPGYKPVKPMVFCGLYPVDTEEYEALRASLGRLHLNDSAFVYQPEASPALGFGFRCGLLGLLHMEIVQERLEREFGLELLRTQPNVLHEVVTTDGERLRVETPSQLPPPQQIDRIEEPFVSATILVPSEHLGPILALLQERRGRQLRMEYIDTRTVSLIYELPLNEIVVDFYDRLKSASKGYASFDYEVIDFRPAPLVKLDILVNGEPVDALSAIIHKDRAYQTGKALVEQLRRLIPRQLFEVMLQAAIGGRIIARENIKPMRKQVTAKLYGGDVTRKRKLLEKQKAGKKRMKKVGRVEIPQEAFMAILGVER
ncbi:MAG: elongation factor 4 [Nitrospinae bacterium]|nr:elongation factor 4 [Nitrospinota bacterium]